MAARRRLQYSDVKKNNSDVLKQLLRGSDSEFDDSDKDPDYIPDVPNNAYPASNSESEVRNIHNLYQYVSM